MRVNFKLKLPCKELSCKRLSNILQAVITMCRFYWNIMSFCAPIMVFGNSFCRFVIKNAYRNSIRIF